MTDADADANRTEPLRVGIVTVSDRVHAGAMDDRGGPAIADYLEGIFVSPWTAERRVVPDDRETIARTLMELVHDAGCRLVLTTGGTGPAERDVTPEATADVCHKLLPGFGERMRTATVDRVPTAILARQVAGVCGSSLIVNLPGKPSAVAECLDAVIAAVPDCLHLLGAPRLRLDPDRIRAPVMHG